MTARESSHSHSHPTLLPASIQNSSTTANRENRSPKTKKPALQAAPNILYASVSRITMQGLIFFMHLFPN